MRPKLKKFKPSRFIPNHFIPKIYPRNPTKKEKKGLSWHIAGASALLTALILIWVNNASDGNIRTQPLTSNSPQESQQNKPIDNTSTPSTAAIKIPKELSDDFKSNQMMSAVQQPKPTQPNTIEISVQKGDSLTKILSKQGVSATQAHNIHQALKKIQQKILLYPKQILSLSFNQSDTGEQQIAAIQIPASKSKVIHIHIPNNNTGIITAKIHQKPLEKRIVYRSGIIQNSLFLSANKAGISDELIMELAQIFAWEVDFAQDIRQGDNFKMLYEENWLEGEKIGNGEILAAEFTNKGKIYNAIYFKNEQANLDGFFADNGSSLKKAFLRTPVDFARISSRFNLKRKHPILHRFRAHKGVDYAAARGTPIKATGQGTVEFQGTKGGYGKTLVLKHGQKYTTLYAHLQRFGKNLRRGSKVSQGQVIGYVGSSGLATGPHLHYEFRVNGAHKDPLTVKLPKARSISKALLPEFQAKSNQIKQLFNQYDAGEYALFKAETFALPESITPNQTTTKPKG